MPSSNMDLTGSGRGLLQKDTNGMLQLLPNKMRGYTLPKKNYRKKIEHKVNEATTITRT